MNHNDIDVKLFGDSIEPNESKSAINDKIMNLLSFDSRDLCIMTRINKNVLNLKNLVDLTEMNLFLKNESNIINVKNSVNKEEIEIALQESYDYRSFLDVFESFDLDVNNYLSTRKLNNLEENFVDNVQDCIFSTIKSIDGEKNRILNLNKLAKQIYNQTGTWSLYLVYDFCLGTTSKPSCFNAPLLLISIEIKPINNQIIIKRKDSQWVVNEKLIQLLKRDYGYKQSIDLRSIKTLEDATSLVSIIMNKDGINELSTSGFQNLKTQEINELYLNKVNHYQAPMIGLFEPQGGAIKNDLIQIIDEGIDPFVDEGSSFNQSVNDRNYHFFAFNNEPPLMQINRPMNLYQKYATYSSLARNTLIYGPPGTGKSQVISNIIFNCILKNNNILVVSDKQAALDVLEERLSEVNGLALYLYKISDKEEFYNKIKSVLDLLDRFWLSSKPPVYDEFEIIKYLNKNKDYKNVVHFHDVQKTNISIFNNLVSSKDSNNHHILDYFSLLDQFKNRPNILKNHTQIYRTIRDELSKLGIDFVSFKNRIETTFNFFLNHSIAFNETNYETIHKHLRSMIELELKYNLTSTYLKDKKNFDLKVSILNDFLVKSNLFDIVKNTVKHDQLIESFRIAKAFCEKYRHLLTEPEVYSFLLNNENTHKQFLRQYENSTQKDQPYIAEQYLVNRVIVTKKPLLKKVSPNKKYLDIVSLLKDYYSNLDLIAIGFSRIVAFLDIDNNILSKNVFLLHVFNHIYSNTYVQSLYNKSFDDSISYEILKLFIENQLTIEDYTTLNDIYQFEKEVLIDYSQMSSMNLFNDLNNYRQAEITLAKNIAPLFFQKYIELLKKKVCFLSPSLQEEIKSMIQVLHRNNKPDIAQFILQYYKVLRIIFPIWIAKPNDVCELLPLCRNIFDYGIYDEASQMFLEKSYPILYRTKIKIVAGDEMQLRPTSFFNSKTTQEIEEYDIDDLDTAISLLDRAKVSLWSSYILRNHYRSKSSDLITFSNQYIYNNNLHFASQNIKNDVPLMVIDVEDGVFDGINTREAEVVLKQLEKNAKQYEKILIITFNNKQSDYISSLLYSSYNYDHIITKKMEADLIQVTNLENVQGNEADLVILSVSYAYNSNGILNNKFGPLMQKNGMNRLNVAITRAVSKMIVVKSIRQTDLKVNTTNKDLKVFFDFISFLDLKKAEALTDSYLAHQVHYENEKVLSYPSFSLYQILLSKLEENEIIVHQFYIGNYLIDFGIYNKEDKTFRLLIVFFDYNLQYKNKNYLNEVYDMYNHLSDLKYQVFIINPLDFYLGREQQIKKILNP